MFDPANVNKKKEKRVAIQSRRTTALIRAGDSTAASESALAPAAPALQVEVAREATGGTARTTRSPGAADAANSDPAVIHWYESLILFLMYFGYLAVMAQNKNLHYAFMKRVMGKSDAGVPR
ncbi:calcium, potassium:sodium antiporter [Aureococcus anophagefferens]|nr:calcium, potassium:sodium antiporter [Aureococcus anophagefferens]